MLCFDNRYIDNLLPPLSIEEQEKLLFQMKNGDELARRTLIERNIRLVVSVAKHYVGRGVPLDDLIQEGTIGLMRALEKFELEKGYLLSTYATFWIQQSIERSIVCQKDGIRLGIDYAQKVNSYNKQKGLLIQSFGRELTMQEIADYLNMDIKKVEKYETLVNKQRSLNELIADEYDTELIEIIEDKDIGEIEEKLYQEDLQKALDELLDTSLTEKERLVLIYRWGLRGTKAYKQEEVAKMLGVTHQRIQQIETNAIDQLRRKRVMKELSIYMDFPEKAYEKLRTLRYKQV